MNAASDSYAIRPFRRSDRSAVRSICAATAWMGEPAADLVGDEWIWSEYWTRYFTDRQWRTCWVAITSGDGRVVGYLTGTPNVAAFDAYVPHLLAGIAWRAIRRRMLRRPDSRRAIFNFLGAAVAGQLDLPAGVARTHPATFHFNLLSEARHRGLGSALLRTFLARMRSLGVPGVHAEVLGVNRASVVTLARAGFRPAHSRPLTAFRHVTADALTLDTCLLDL